MDQLDPVSILTVGSLAFDTIQTPAGKVEKLLGGSGNYFSIAASFYSPVDVIGVVGEDFPKAHLEWLEARKIGTQGIQILPGKTFHWVGSYGKNLREAHTLSTSLNVCENFHPSLSPLHQKAHYLFLANIDPDLQESVLNQVESPRFVACDSMNFWITSKPTSLQKTLKHVDLLSLNETESFLLSGENHILRAAEKILQMGPSVLVIKRGEAGAVMFTKQGMFIAPAFPVLEVIDPTGAGDSFAGALMGYLAEAHVHRDLAITDPTRWEQLLRRAVLAGCVMASFTVEDFSFQRLTRLTPAELISRQNALIEMTALK